MSLARGIAKRALEDPEFRRRLQTDPKAAIESEFGRKIFGEGVTVYIHENSETAVHIILPPPLALDAGRPLTNEQLQEVAGGRAFYRTDTYNNTDCTCNTYWAVC